MFLNCHSYHSLRYGTLSIKVLVEQAQALGIKELVLTDINTVTGIYEFKKQCEDKGIKPIPGVEVRKDGKLLYVAIAGKFSGIGEINKVITDHHCNGKELDERAPELKDVWIVYPMSNIPSGLKDNEYIGVRTDELNFLIRPEYKKHISKMVVLHPITFSTGEEYELHTILRAIDHNTLLSKLTKREVCRRSEYFVPEQDIVKAFERYPQIIENTKRILEQSNFEFDFEKVKNKQYYTKSKASDVKLLRRLAYLGLNKRYGKDHDIAKKELKKSCRLLMNSTFVPIF